MRVSDTAHFLLHHLEAGIGLGRKASRGFATALRILRIILFARHLKGGAGTRHGAGSRLPKVLIENDIVIVLGNEGFQSEMLLHFRGVLRRRHAVFLLMACHGTQQVFHDNA